MRNVDDRLHGALEGGIAQFVEKDRHDNRRGEKEQQIDRGDNGGVSKELPKYAACEESLEMLEADPVTAKETLVRRIVLKRGGQIRRRHVPKQEQVRKTGNQHEVEQFVVYYVAD